MALNLDSRTIAVISIILGLLSGYYVGTSFISKPQIDQLNTQIEIQSTNIQSLQANYTHIENEYEELESTYNELVESSSNEITTLEERIDLLENQVSDLSESNDSLSTEYDTLENEYMSTLNELEDLEIKFNEIYNPGYVSFTNNDLVVNLTISETSYTDNVPINGMVSIRHSNGDPFEGTFQLKLTKIVVGVGTPSDSYEIMGDTDYYWENPFVPGAGSYKLSLSQVLDSQGNPAIPSVDLIPFFISIFMG